MKAKELIIKHEGFEPFTYRCESGRLTIGYGFNLDAIPMPQVVADIWLGYLITEITIRLSQDLDFFSTLSENRQAVLIDMAYNLGCDGLYSFQKMITAIKEKDYDRASDEMIDSKWYNQVGVRGKENERLMREG